MLCSMCDLNSLPGLKRTASAVGAQCLNPWTTREVPLCRCLNAKGAREEVSTGSHLPGSSGGSVATCSEYSGAPRLQELGSRGACVHRPFPGVPLSPAPGVGLLWGKARPGTSPVQLASSPCGVCPQPERGLCPIGQFESESKNRPPSRAVWFLG